jgi:hypothetical protein
MGSIFAVTIALAESLSLSIDTFTEVIPTLSHLTFYTPRRRTSEYLLGKSF